MAFPLSIDSFPGIRDDLRKTFKSGKLRPLQYRKQQLAQVAYMIQENGDALNKAILADMNRPYLDTTLGELVPIVNAALDAINRLDAWSSPTPVPEADLIPYHKDWDLKAIKSPRGVVLIVGPWNYPIILTLWPLIGAIAAGCCAIIKPSEVASHVSSLLYELVPKYLDQAAYRVIPGSVAEITALLDLQWDKIFYTGNERVGRIVATAAAKHLTPCTLELGSKTPVLIDPALSEADLRTAVRRIAYAKCQNAGQVCVSPDYAVVPTAIHDQVVALYKEVIKEFYPEGADKSDSYARIINENHFKRVKKLLAETKGKVVLGGNTSDTGGKFYIEPTLLVDVKRDDILLHEELFAPILPVIEVKGVDAGIEVINSLPNPLAIYVFTNSPEVKQKVTEETLSGRVVFNETTAHLGVTELPFGGVGASGYGSQMGKYTYEGFTLTRGSIDVPFEAEAMFKLRYPPYTEDGQNFFDSMYRVPIPLPKQTPGQEKKVLDDVVSTLRHVMAI